MNDITGKEYIYGLAQDKNGAPYLFNIGELVRCKDCKHKVLTEDGEYNPEDIVCEYWMSDGLEETDFCSYGERKGGAE